MAEVTLDDVQRAGKVLVPSTVKDVDVGGASAFEDRGERWLEGVPAYGATSPSAEGATFLR